MRYLLEVKAAYLEHYEEGLLAPNTLLTLLNSINEALDLTDEPLRDWRILRGLYKRGGCLVRCGLKLHYANCCSKLVEKIIFRQMRSVYDIF